MVPNDSVPYRVYHIEGIYCEKNLANHKILLSVEIFVIFDYCIHNTKYIEDIRIQKCVLALIFASRLEIWKFCKIKTRNKFLPYGIN